MSLIKPATQLREKTVDSEKANRKAQAEAQRALALRREQKWEEFFDKKYEAFREKTKNTLEAAAKAGKFSATISYFTYDIDDDTLDHYRRMTAVIKSDLAALGYNCDYTVSNGVDYGVGSDPGPPMFTIGFHVSWK